MTRSNRGGQTLKSGKIGRWNIIRQQRMLPGERINIDIKGKIKLESLRERDSLRINAHLAIFQTPIRWLVPEWPNIIKAGYNAAQVPVYQEIDLAKLGLGAPTAAQTNTIQRYWLDAPLRIHNEWLKWPEDPDVAGLWPADGTIAVPLQHAWNRCRYNVDPTNEDDFTQASETSFDVRKLAETQARFRSAIERDVLSYNRYMELINEMYGARGDREVDQVPMMVDQVEVGVNPREIPATDGASLGQWQSLFDFSVDHQVRGVTCAEHCVLTYMLCLRFAPIIEGRNPLASGRLDWPTEVGDPEILKATSPQEVQIRDVAARSSTVSLGYLPAGWQYRSGFDVVGARVDVRDSFPYMKVPDTRTEAKDATRVKNAFRSQSLGDYMCDIYVNEDSINPIANSLESYFSGMKGEGSKAEFPKQGKMI